MCFCYFGQYDFVKHSVTNFSRFWLSVSGALRNIHNPACTYTQLHPNVTDQLSSAAHYSMVESWFTVLHRSVYGFSVKSPFLGSQGSNPFPSQIWTKFCTLWYCYISHSSRALVLSASVNGPLTENVGSGEHRTHGSEKKYKSHRKWAKPLLYFLFSMALTKVLFNFLKFGNLIVTNF